MLLLFNCWCIAGEIQWNVECWSQCHMYVCMYGVGNSIGNFICHLVCLPGAGTYQCIQSM